MDAIENNHYVKDMIKGEFLAMYDFDYDKDKYQINIKDIASIIYDNWSEDLTKIPFDEGRGPENENEIAFTGKVLKDSSLKVGDYIDLTVEGVTNTYLITGSYTSMLNGGFSVGFHNDLYKLIHKTPEYNYLFVYLNDAKDYSAFRKEITTQYKDVSIEVINEEIKTAALSVVDIAKPVCFLLTIVFILFSVINIINLLALESLNNRRQFGILKSLGFSDRYICLKFIWKTMLLTIFSILLAIGIYAAALRKCFQLSVGINGLVTSYPNTGLLILIIVALIFLITIMFCLPLRRITPKDLMEE
jgi:putative ABC transport system permease protein